jgi:hypothetical protein
MLGPAAASIGQLGEEAQPMTQIDPHAPTGVPAPSDDHRPTAPRQDRGFNLRVSVGMAVGLVVLLGVLFGLRAPRIFPPEPGQDPEIAAARATQAALGTQEASVPRLTAVVPTAHAAASSATAATSAAQPNATAGPPVAAPAAQTALPVSVATTQPLPASTSAPPSVPTSVPTAQPNPTEVPPDPTPVQAAVPADLAAAIVQGYSNYWSVRVRAERDPSDATVDLESVMAGNELVGARRTLSEYVEAGEAFETSVKHQIWITSATTDQAVIVDRYSATTSKLDPETKIPLHSNPTVENRTDTFVLHRLDGVWKVVDEP